MEHCPVQHRGDTSGTQRTSFEGRALVAMIAVLIGCVIGVGSSGVSSSTSVAALSAIGCDGSEVVSSDPTSISRFNTSTFASAVLLDDSDIPGMVATNQVGVNSDGTKVYATTKMVDGNGVESNFVVDFDVINDTAQVVPMTAITGVAGAVDLSTGLFYFGNHSQTVVGPSGSTDRAAVYNVYDAASGIVTAGVATIRLAYLDENGDPFLDSSGNQVFPGGAGDVTFDNDGNMYLLSGSADHIFVYKVPGPLPTTPNSNVIEPEILYFGETPNTAFVGGVAFGADGGVYLAAGGTLFSLDMASGASTAISPLASNDVGSCVNPPQVQVQKEIPIESGRQAATDQFTLSVAGGVPAASAVTTAGNDTGIQGQVSTPVLAQWGAQYTISEAAAGTTDLALYGASWECIDTAHGNSVIASGSGSTGTFTMPDVANIDALCTITNVARKDTAIVSKSSNPTSGTEVTAGQVVQYTLTFDNSANTAPSPVAYVDQLSGVLDDATLTSAPTVAGDGVAVGAVSDGQFSITGEVAPGSTATVTYTVTVNDMPSPDFELVNFLYEADTATPSECGAGEGLCTINPVDTNPAIRLIKTAEVTDVDGSGTNTVGDTVTYSFEVVNTGDVDLSEVVVTDPLLGDGSMDCPSSGLSVGDKMDCLGVTTYALTADDVVAGVRSNTATVSAVGADGVAVSDASRADVEVDGIAGVELVKTAVVTDVDTSGNTTVGDTVTYSFVVVNRGTTPLTGIVVTDPLLGDGPMDCEQDALEVGETMRCDGTSERTITNADLERGELVNTATVIGSDPDGTEVADESTATVPVVGVADIDMVKTGTVTDLDGSGTNTAGDTIAYRFVVTNTGTTELTNIVVEDPMLGSLPMTCPQTTLEPGATMTCHAETDYVLTAGHVTEGILSNTATVVGFDPFGGDVHDDSTVELLVVGSPSITITKHATVNDRDNSASNTVGDTVQYTFTVTNRGNVPLTEVRVTDPLFGDEPMDCPKPALEVGEEMTCKAPRLYTLSPLDAARGFRANIGTVEASDPDDETVADDNTNRLPVSTTPTPGKSNPATPAVPGNTPGTGAQHLLSIMSLGALAIASGAVLVRMARRVRVVT